MLYKETVTKATMQMLEKLMADPYLKDFYLVGGTNLSLRYGHRISDDIDLFTHKDFDKKALADHMEKHYDLYWKEPKMNGYSCYPDGQKVDFYHYPSTPIKGVEEIDGNRMLSAEDVAAMKMNSIAVDGTRVKDFIDIHTVLDHIPLLDLSHVYSQKYTDRDVKEDVKMMAHHEAVEKDFPKVKVLKKQLTNQKVFGDLKQQVKEYIKKTNQKKSNLIARNQRKTNRRKGPKL